MSALALQQALVAELTLAFPRYSVAARSPLEQELRPLTLWVNFEDIETPTGIADLGHSTGLLVPLFVVLLMDVPDSDAGAQAVNGARLRVISAAVRAIRAFPDTGVLATLAGEATIVDKGLLISSTRINAEYNLEVMS